MKGLLAVLCNCEDYSYANLLCIQQASARAIEFFPEIEVEQAVRALVQENLIPYRYKLSELCRDILATKDPYLALDRIYEEVARKRKEIDSFFRALEEGLGLPLDYAVCVKEKATAQEKVAREAARSSALACFEALKDLLRCRATVHDCAALKKALDYLQEHRDVLQVKDGLAHSRVPTVYVVCRLPGPRVLPPVEVQLLYKDRSPRIHDFYDLARLDNSAEFAAWARRHLALAFPVEKLSLARQDYQGSTDPKAEGNAQNPVTAQKSDKAMDQPMITTTIFGGRRYNKGADQLDYPSSVFVDRDTKEVFVADNLNNRIQAFAQGSTTGRTVCGGRGKGNNADQLNYPSSVFVDRDTKEVFVADTHNHRVQAFAQGSTTGRTVCGGRGKGKGADQLDYPRSVYVDCDTKEVFVADWGNHRVQAFAQGSTTGRTVCGGRGQGKGADQLSYPRSVFVDCDTKEVFVADYFNDRVQKVSFQAFSGNNNC